jgi:hypothetical protein
VGEDKYIVETIDERTRKSWDRERWRDDGVSALPDGFSLKKNVAVKVRGSHSGTQLRNLRRSRVSHISVANWPADLEPS